MTLSTKRAIIETSKVPTPADIVRAKTSKTAAKRFHAYICALAKASGQNPDIEVALWSPKEAKERGWGTNWAVAWEGGPYEWAVALSLGSQLHAGDYGYSQEGPFPSGIHGSGWFCEPYNNFIMCFVED